MISSERKRELGIRVTSLSSTWIQKRYEIIDSVVTLDYEPIGDLTLIYIFETDESKQIVDLVSNVTQENNKVFFENDNLNGKYALISYLANKN